MRYVGVGEVKPVVMSLWGVMQAVQFMMAEFMPILNSDQILSFSTCINHVPHGIRSSSLLLIYCKRVLQSNEC